MTLDEQLNRSEFYANPYPVYQLLRSEDPVHWSEIMGSWILTRYEDVMSSMRDAHLFSNAGRHALSLNRLPEALQKKAKPIYDHYAVGLIHSDPPDHTRIRALVNKVFTTQAMECLRPRIHSIVNQLLDAVSEAGKMDVIRDFAYPLPVAIISEILGVSTEDHDQFKYWSDGISGLTATGCSTPENLERGLPSLHHLREYLGRLIAQRRKQPKDDLISVLVAVEDQGDRLSEDELLTTYQTLITAGFETTMNLIGNGLLSLLRNPEQLQLLKDNPDLVDGAIEEMLRYESPFQRNWRVATVDLELEGKSIRAGQLVAQMLGAANRDPAQFPDPDRFDITRQPNRHIAFGYGIHFCVGAPLARLEASIAFNTLLRRLPELRLGSDVIEWRKEIVFRGLKSLPVLFDGNQ